SSPPAAGQAPATGAQAARRKPHADAHESRRDHRCHPGGSGAGHDRAPCAHADSWSYPPPRRARAVGERARRATHRAGRLGQAGLGPADRRKRAGAGALPAGGLAAAGQTLPRFSGRHAAAEAELRIGTLDQLTFQLAETLDRAIHILALTELIGELQIVLIMP